MRSDERKVSKEPIKSTLRFRGYCLSVLQEEKQKERKCEFWLMKSVSLDSLCSTEFKWSIWRNGNHSPGTRQCYCGESAAGWTCLDGQVGLRHLNDGLDVNVLIMQLIDTVG